MGLSTVAAVRFDLFRNLYTVLLHRPETTITGKSRLSWAVRSPGLAHLATKSVSELIDVQVSDPVQGLLLTRSRVRVRVPLRVPVRDPLRVPFRVPYRVRGLRL